MLQREVYTKDLKGQTMVRKFMLWKTNKDAAGDEFPAYVARFSPNRKDALAREVRVLSSPDQIQQLYVALKDENVKASWERRGGLIVPAAAASDLAEATPAEPLAAKPAKKKPAAKKLAAETPAPAETPQPESPMAPSERVKKPGKKKSG